MAKTRLLQAVCTVAMLAAVPAFAQRPEAGMTGAGGAPNPAAQQPAPNASSGGTSSMTPATQDGTGSSASAESHSTHRSAMAHPTGSMRGRSDRSQDAAVDRLNEQSYQAAQQGQSFGSGSSDAGPGAMSSPGGSGSMKGMSGGSMPSNGPATKP
jgi:hypothetical protein